jgi:hypothetical protein
MSSPTAPRCQHVKVSGTQCGSPALRNKTLCFFHQQNRPLPIECYADIEWATGEIYLPALEDAHSIQTVIRQVIQMAMQKRIERKTASLLLYALQVASSNLKRMDQEKPQPADVVTDPEALAGTVVETNLDQKESEVCAARETGTNSKPDTSLVRKDETAEGNALPPEFTIQACFQPESRTLTRRSERKKQYVI